MYPSYTQCRFGGYLNDIVIIIVIIACLRNQLTSQIHRSVSNIPLRDDGSAHSIQQTTAMKPNTYVQIIVELNTYAVLPSVQVHDEVFWFRVPELHPALVTMRVVRELLCVEVHVRHVLSCLRGHVQCIIVLQQLQLIGLSAL